MCVYRKADLRELKVLQRMENKQYQDLMFKAQYLHDQQERKFEQEMQVGATTALGPFLVVSNPPIFL